MERERERGGERMRDLARLKPKTYNSIQVFHLNGSGPSTLGTFFCLPRRISRNLNGKWNNQDLNWLAFKGDAGTSGGDLTLCAKTPVPTKKIVWEYIATDCKKTIKNAIRSLLISPLWLEQTNLFTEVLHHYCSHSWVQIKDISICKTAFICHIFLIKINYNFYMWCLLSKKWIFLI